MSRLLATTRLHAALLWQAVRESRAKAFAIFEAWCVLAIVAAVTVGYQPRLAHVVYFGVMFVLIAAIEHYAVAAGAANQRRMRWVITLALAVAVSVALLIGIGR